LIFKGYDKTIATVPVIKQRIKKVLLFTTIGIININTTASRISHHAGHILIL
jgi:hypothetical protein